MVEVIFGNELNDGNATLMDMVKNLRNQIDKMKRCINCKKCNSIDDICCGRVYLCYNTEEDGEQTYPECVCDDWEFAN